MARFHISFHDTSCLAMRGDGEGQKGQIDAWGPPIGTPTIYEVVAAAKIEFPSGTLGFVINMVDGAIYVKTGSSATPNIAAPAGMLVPAELKGMPYSMGVGQVDGVRHTHLLVVEADPDNDTATDLNA